MKPRLRIHFTDFWPNFQPTDNYFFNLLSLRFEVVIDPKTPEVLFFSYDYTGRAEHKAYPNGSCIKIYYTGENSAPDYNFCDYSLTFQDTGDPRNYRLPLWMLHLNWFNRPYQGTRDHAYLHPPEKLLNKHEIDARALYRSRSKFCCFIATQDKGRRSGFFDVLNARERVDAGGKLRNNLGYAIPGRSDEIYKMKFLEQYRFTMAFENTIAPGYTTEKVIQPMFSNTIPIYWGNLEVAKDFNTKSFLNYADFPNEEALLERIFEIHHSEQKFVELFSQPWFNNNKIPEFALPESVLGFLVPRVSRASSLLG